MKTAVIEALEKFYGKNDAEIRLFYSPGRVNLRTSKSNRGAYRLQWRLCISLCP